MLGTPCYLSDDVIRCFSANAGLCFARKLHQAGQGGAARNQEQDGVRAAEQDAAAAAKAQQEHVQKHAAELQWDPLGFRQVVLQSYRCSIERCCDTVMAQPQAQTAHVSYMLPSS